MNNAYAAIFSLLLSSSIMSMEPDIKKTCVDLEKIKSMCLGIYQQAQGDNFKPDLLVGIARGGLIPLGLLAGEPMLNNRNIVTISTESYNDAGQQLAIKLRVPIDLSPYQNAKSVLLIDDIADSGETIHFVHGLLEQCLRNAAIKTAVLFYKKKSKIKPDYYVEETTDWIVFPWEG